MNLYLFSYFTVLLNLIVLLLDKTYIQLVYLFVILPLVDTFIPLPVKLLEPTKNTVLHDLLLYLWYPIEILFFVLHIYLKRTSVIDTLVMGVILGLGINIAHELIHKRQFFKKFIESSVVKNSINKTLNKYI